VPGQTPHLCQLPDDTITLAANQFLDGFVAQDDVWMLRYFHPATTGRQDL
jgi:hypothetical protein